VKPEQLSLAAEALYQEALRTAAFAVEEDLGEQLAGLGTSPTREALLGWCRNFRLALPVKCQVVPRALVWALECEIEGDGRQAVLVLVGALVHLGHIELREAEETEAELGPSPSDADLCTALRRWIRRGAAWGGPILGWMRDLCHRLEDRWSA
jgi:hypothetical protein